MVKKRYTYIPGKKAKKADDPFEPQEQSLTEEPVKKEAPPGIRSLSMPLSTSNHKVDPEDLSHEQLQEWLFTKIIESEMATAEEIKAALIRVANKEGYTYDASVVESILYAAAAAAAAAEDEDYDDATMDYDEVVWEYLERHADRGRVLLYPKGGRQPTDREVERAKRLEFAITALVNCIPIEAVEFEHKMDLKREREAMPRSVAMREERKRKGKGTGMPVTKSEFLYDLIHWTHLMAMVNYKNDEESAEDLNTSSSSDENESSESETEQKKSSTMDEEKITVADEQEFNAPGAPEELKKVVVASSEVDPPISKDLSSFGEDEEKITVADEQEFNAPGAPEELKKIVDASSEVDPLISKDLSSFAAGDCPEVTNGSASGEEVDNVIKIDQVDSLKGEFPISFDFEDFHSILKTVNIRDGPIPLPLHENPMGEGEAELRNAINKGIRSGFPFPKESKKAPVSMMADSLILNEFIPSFRPSSFESGDCPDAANTSNETVKGDESSNPASAFPKESKKAVVPSVEDEEEWHDEDTHGSFNPADPKCKCAIS